MSSAFAPKTKGEIAVFTKEEAIKTANEIGYPVLIRPSYVLGGQGMQIAISDEDISEFMDVIQRYAQETSNFMIQIPDGC